MSVSICVAVREESTEKAIMAARGATMWADLVEFRADFIRDLSIPALLKQKPCPVVFTLRSCVEGGEFEGSHHDRMEALVEAIRCGADYVDVEFSAFRSELLARIPSERIILSHHNFEGTPRSLEALARDMASTGAAALKIVTTARCLTDNLTIFRLLEYGKRSKLKICALAMGSKGIPSRILGPSRGSWLAFASLPGGDATAEGQIPADLLMEQYRLKQLGPEPKLYGVVGMPLSHTLSPHVHNAVFGARDEDAIFLPLEAAGFDDFQHFQEELTFQGASVTLPFKTEAMARAASHSSSARKTGAVNTLVRSAEGWFGDNTDVEGFLGPLKRRLKVMGIRALVLGAGGAARAAIFGLLREGAAVTVSARRLEKARDLADAFQVTCSLWERLGDLEWDLLVNTTPVGMHPSVEATPVPAESLTGTWVYDLIYNPAETLLLREADRRGCHTISGMEMFIEQAKAQQKLWNSLPIPDDVMEKAMVTGMSRLAQTGNRRAGS